MSKKYIKASDGSFISFAKKDKKTFRPVTAACGGKKTVTASGDATDFSAFRWDWDEWDDYGKRINPTAAMKAAVKSEAGDVVIDKVLKPTGSIGKYLKNRGIQALIFVYDPESDFEDMYVEVFGWTGNALDDSSSYMLADLQDNAGIEGSTKRAGRPVKASLSDSVELENKGTVSFAYDGDLMRSFGPSLQEQIEARLSGPVNVYNIEIGEYLTTIYFEIDANADEDYSLEDAQQDLIEAVESIVHQDIMRAADNSDLSTSTDADIDDDDIIYLEEEVMQLVEDILQSDYNLWSEPSVQGGRGRDFIYDTTTNECVGVIDYQDELNYAREALESNNGDSEAAARDIAAWIAEWVER